jgi:Ser/Thr protein kinase RdoA (MazF antagonist)
VIDAGRTTVGWICAAFGLPEVPDAAIIPVSRGAMGQIWRLDLGADRFAVKELFWDADEESARNEAELTAHLEAAGIRLPASVPLVTCHRDLHPDNVLVDGSGELVLLDWDDAGPASPGRELAYLLVAWHVHDGKPDAAAVRSTIAAYQAAGGPGRIRDEQSFGMLIACMLNFLQSQAGVALDPHAAAGHRQHADDEIADTLARLPTPTLIAQLIDLAAPLTS